MADDPNAGKSAVNGESGDENSEKPAALAKNDVFETKLDSIYLTEARVYIAGVLMPVTRVTVTTTFNQMPTAEIALPAYAELLYLGEYDRVPVHIFVRETMVEAQEFILIFEGFITSTTYVNSALQRSVVANAVSCFDILNDIRANFLTQLEDWWESCIDGAEDIAIRAPNLYPQFPEFLFRYKLISPAGTAGASSVSGEDDGYIRFPSDFLESVYAFVQLCHPPKGVNGWEENPKLGHMQASALTIFYGEYARAINFLARFERLPYFDKKACDGKYAWDATSVKFSEERATVFPMLYGMQTQLAIGSLSNQIMLYDSDKRIQTLMHLLNFLVEEMEYEYLVITNPAYHAPEEEEAAEEVQNEQGETSEGGKKPEQKPESSEEKEEPKPGIDEPADKRGRLVCSCLKPLLMDALPPGCNVMYRSLVDNVTVHLEHKGTPTRARVHDAHSPLALLVSPNASTLAKRAGLIDYYPSKKHKNFDPDDAVAKYLNFLNTELLESERYCGPWIKELTAPRWIHYLYTHPQDPEEQQPTQMQANGQEVEPLKVFKERFLRRQLLLSKYANHRARVTGMFDPYVTPGFPGVIYDNEVAGFAFAGHVITVAHTITPTDVSTQVIMDFCRPLCEAAKIEIPNALSFMHDLTHKSDPLTEIYQAILGTPFVFNEEEDGSKSDAEREEKIAKFRRAFNLKMPGACALSWKNLDEKATGSESAQDPNNNPREAYRAKRRNICTFDNYLKFMKLTPAFQPGPEGPNTPVLLKGKYLEDRRPLDIYQKEILFKAVVPEKEQNIPEGEKPEAPKSPSTQAEEKGKAQEEKKEKEIRLIKEMDVCSLLFSIAKREFSKIVYKADSMT